MMPSRTVVFAVPPQLHLLDLAGPAQVFSAANDEGGRYRLRYVAADGPVVSHQGLPLVVEPEWPDFGRDDLLLVPGRRVEREVPARWLDAAAVRAVRHHAERGGALASVCSGAFALAAAGVLDGRRATTHHDIQDALARRHPRVTVVRDVLFVADGRVATSAGIASGIDLALHLVSGDLGPAATARVARALVVPARRNGDAAQVPVMLRHRDHLQDVVHRTQDVLDTRFADTLPLAELARIAGVSERTLTRLFVRATGLTPLRYQQALRVERADVLAGQGWTRDAAAREVGLADARMLRRLRAGATSGSERRIDVGVAGRKDIDDSAGAY